MSCDSASSQNHVDQGPADPAVPIDERMDRFELRVRERRLDHRRQRVSVAESGQGLQERLYFLGRRRYEGSGTRVVVAAADPVLLRSNAATVLGQSTRRQQTAMDFEKDVQRNFSAMANRIGSERHCVDVC